MRTVKRIEDVVTPGFTALQKCGGFLPLNPVTISTITETRTASDGPYRQANANPMTCYLKKDDGPFWVSRSWRVGIAAPSSLILADLSNRAAAKAIQSTFDALTFAAEARETAAMLERVYLRTFHYAELAAARAKRVRKNPAEAFTRYWMEYRYGWGPLVFSLQDAVRAFSNDLKVGDRLSGAASQSEQLTAFENYTVSPKPNERISVTEVLQGTRTYRAKAFSEVTGLNLDFGFNPFLTAYEIIPLSFVVDWFLDINSWLVNLTNTEKNAKLIAVQTSVKDSYYREQTIAYDWNGGLDSGGVSGIKTHQQFETYTRSPSGVSLPSLNPRITSVRVLDAAALILGRYSRVISRFATGR